MACKPLELDWSLKHLVGALYSGASRCRIEEEYFYMHYYFIIAPRHRHMHTGCLTGRDKGPTVLVFRGGVLLYTQVLRPSSYRSRPSRGTWNFPLSNEQ